MIYLNSTLRNKKYWSKLLPALIWHISYMLCSSHFSMQERVYVDCVFYSGLVIYFNALGDWKFSEWIHALSQDRSIVKNVLYAIIGMVLAFGMGIIIQSLLGYNEDLVVFLIGNWADLIVFAVSAILLAPIAEEVFYRQAIIVFGTKSILAISTVASILLYASEHSMNLTGFLIACFWALPMSITYIKTKNVYVCMTAHLLCNIVVNGITVVTEIAKIYN